MCDTNGYHHKTYLHKMECIVKYTTLNIEYKKKELNTKKDGNKSINKCTKKKK